MSQPRVVISGSYNKNWARIVDAKHALEAAGAVVVRPATDEIELDAKAGIGRLAGDPYDPAEVQRQHLEAITGADFLYVVNPAGYVGPDSTRAIGWAAAKDVAIIFSEPPFEAGDRCLAMTTAAPAHAVAAFQTEETL